MKNKFILLFLLLLIKDAYSADYLKEGVEASNQTQPLIAIKENYRIQNYPTYLKYVPSRAENEFFLDIYSDDDKQIGEITLKYFDHGEEYYPEKGGDKPIVRLSRIKIKEEYQQRGHATRAMETMFTVLRKYGKFTDNTEMWLEYNKVEQKFLEKFYTSFGFVNTEEPTWPMINIVKLQLSKSKFPFYKKTKETQTAMH